MKILKVHKTRVGGVAVHVKEVRKDLERRCLKVDEISRLEDLHFKNFYTSYFQMKKMFQKWSKKYDIIHTHDWSITYPAIKSKIKNLVATFHAFPTNPIAALFENYCINVLKERAIVVSPKMKSVYTKAVYIPNGVNLKFFRKIKNIKRQPFLAGISQRYNYSRIIDVFKETKTKFISTNGKLEWKDIPKFYSKISIFVSIPYKQAGFNMVWLEAMACEVPYIIGTSVGIGEILPIYKISNLNELKEILIKIKNGKIEPLKNQRKWIVNHGFTWENHVKKLLKIYEEVAK